jgi:hypothetical protein
MYTIAPLANIGVTHNCGAFIWTWGAYGKSLSYQPDYDGANGCRGVP